MGLEIIAAIVAILAAVLPPLIAAWARNSAEARQQDDALTQRSLDSLHTILERVRARKAQSAVPPE